MNFLEPNLIITVLAALAGGYAGVRLKIPAGAIIGALVATVAVRFWGVKAKEIPYFFSFVAQVLIGLIIGSGVTPKIFDELAKCWVPLVLSVVVLVLIGILSALLIAKLGYLDFPTSFLSTSPGAMSAIVILGVEYGVNGAIVALFHFLRIIVVLVTAPLVLHFLGKWG